MSLEQRNKKVTDVYEKYKIAEWGNGPRRTVSGFLINNSFCNINIWYVSHEYKTRQNKSNVF